MTAMTSAGTEEIGASALRRYFNARMEASSDLISTSMARCWYSQEFESIVERNGQGTRVCLSAYVYLLLWRDGVMTTTTSLQVLA